MGMLIAGFVTAGMVAGLLLVFAGFRGSAAPASARPVKVRQARPPRARRMLRLQIGGAAAGAMLIWAVTGWLPSALLMALTVFFLPWLLNPNKSATEQIERLEALAQWTKRLSDLVKTGIGIEDAIATSVRTAPKPIEREVADLAVRLHSRMEPREALTAFARALGDPRADLVAAALLLRIRDRGPGLADVLSDLGNRTKDIVRRRRDTEAYRAKHRTTVRWICAITVVVVIATSFNKEQVEPYGTPLGMIVMLVLMAAVVALFWWMNRLGATVTLPGFMGNSAPASPAAKPAEQMEGTR
ncbi:type II secretion system F family protein [Streptomyces sp. NBC_00582]|uniref:type II secretion system F family protein n=1 Tax=Streptomyces sp. NBC_00582 TaxID=2975783 RepID=UPI002E81C115|nr:type II secretion system F family protein [Streptomyces sp. NBC_00582]WUB68470.1 type II secretion system F family protein [Streptomyces sp. NBC_00582]